MKFKKEILLIIIIILGIGILEFITSFCSQKSVNKISEKITSVQNKLYEITEAKENFNKETKDNLMKEIENLKNDWYSEEGKLAMFVEHNELEKITKAVVVLEENAKNEEFEVSLENACEFKYWLNHFAEKEKLKFKNIL